MSGNTQPIGVAFKDQLITGTPTNDNAPAGFLGEYIFSTIPSGSAVALTTATPANITSIALTSGDWDIDCQVEFSPGATTSVTQSNASMSLTSATLSTQPGGTVGIATLGPEPILTFNQAASVPAANYAIAPTTTRVTVAQSNSTATVYLVAQATFTVSTMSAFGTLRARRIR
jgi:hypothetical protein